MPDLLLYVDDSPQRLQARKANLERLGFTVAIANSAQDAMTILDEVRIDAVLLDSQPECMDAEAVAFYVKQRFPNEPVLLLSAQSEAEVPESILWLVDDYLMTSEMPGRLSAAIQKVCRPGRVPAPVSRHDVA
jgi:DNA-binding response OmpR family regulator